MRSGLGATKSMTRRARQLRRDSTIPERILWSLLRAGRLVGTKFRRQVPIGPSVVDYLCESAKLVVELDGMSHDGRPEEDHRRSAYLTSLGLRVFRVTNDDVLKSRDAVAGTILRVLNECGHPKPNPHPGPLPQGEGVNQSPLPEGEG